MRQFYSVTVPSTGKGAVIHFEQPVRKKIVLSSMASYIACSIGTETKDLEHSFVMGALQNFELDFQRANTGKGVQDLVFWRYDGGSNTRVSISVSEYGSDGDNKFFE